MHSKATNSAKEPVRVLLIDDEEPQRELAKMNLEAADPSMKITTSALPSEALNILRTQTFDCIISDYQMPEMNGIQLCIEAKKMTNTPFILYTGRGSEEVASEAFRAGVDDYVKKEKDLAHYEILARNARLFAEKMKTERMLRDTESMLRSFFESPGLMRGIVEIVDDSTVKHVMDNEVAARYIGLKPEDMRDKLSTELGETTDVIREWISRFEESRNTGKPVQFEYMDKRGGHEAWLKAIVNYVGLSQSGEPRYAYVVEDITKEKRVEEALLEGNVRSRVNEAAALERQRLLKMFETLPVLICLLTPDYNVAYANRAFEEAFGESRGRKCYEYCFNQPQPCQFCESFKVIETGRPHHWETETLSGRIIEVNDFPFTDVDGKPMVLEMDVDVTEQRRAEERLRKARQLELVSRIGATLAHDLRSPLILASQSLEMTKTQPGNSSKMIEIAKTNVDRAISMIEEFRAGTREVKVVKRPTDLSKLVKTLVDSLSVPKNISVKMLLDDGVVAPLDAELFRRVVDNLVRNAVEVMPEGGELTIRTRREDSVAILKIQDTGTGISEEDAVHVFEPMFTTKKDGLGLGLYFVKTAVDAHGGSIDFESKKGEGTVFTIRLAMA